MSAIKARESVFRDVDIRAHYAQTAKPVCRRERVKAFIFFVLNVFIYIAAENMDCIYIKQ